MDIFSVREIRTLEQVAQISCRVSILGDAQNSICHSPKQPALAGGLDKMISRSPFQPQSFYDSKKKKDSIFCSPGIASTESQSKLYNVNGIYFLFKLLHTNISFAACVLPISFFQILTPFLPGPLACIVQLI